ncbi:flexible cuticle protein 12-like [Aethina tumida]|uniref:flexible cuticle protein 12-like n=1 Tax=Aethina tumida TaxID=116153 RepID=UPI00214838F4|nr:flexible cuticle protein 12-like [Aethina tumida]
MLHNQIDQDEIRKFPCLLSLIISIIWVILQLVVLFAVVSVAVCASVNPDAEAQVLRSELDNIGVDGYKYGYETSNGIVADEAAHLVNVGTDNEAIAVHGSFQYVGADGVTYKVTYVADENGFQPQGAHLPVA